MVWGKSVQTNDSNEKGRNFPPAHVCVILSAIKVDRGLRNEISGVYREPKFQTNLFAVTG